MGVAHVTHLELVRLQQLRAALRELIELLRVLLELGLLIPVGECCVMLCVCYVMLPKSL
jgi:hypothetical protein